MRGLQALGLALLFSATLTAAQTAPLPPGAANPDAKTTTSPPPLAAAEDRLAAKDFAGAQTQLTAYLSAHPDDARALFDLGYLEDAQDQTDRAEREYRRAIAADPLQFESRLALGLLLARKGNQSESEARVQLEAATRLEPRPANPAEQAQAFRALARLLRSSEPGAAREALLAALKLTPETTADTLLTAQIAEASGDPEVAEEAYRRVLAGRPGAGASPSEAEIGEASEAAGGLAHLLIAAQKYPDAETLLRQGLSREPGDPVLNTQLARVLEAEERPEEAIAILENLHQTRPDDLAVSRMLADVYTQAGDAAKADPLYVQLMAAPDPDASLLAARGDNLIRQKRAGEAVPLLQRATRLDPSDGAAWSSLAFAASQAHQPQLTLDALAMRSKVMEETPATYFLAATSCDTLHQTKRAVELYRQFLAVAGGKFPDEEWEAKHRLTALAR